MDFTIFLTLARDCGLSHYEGTWTDTFFIRPGEPTAEVVARYRESIEAAKPEFRNASIRALAVLPAVLVPVA
jgi:hypothetical protein